MRKALPILYSLILISTVSRAGVVTSIDADYRHGQTFIVWDLIPGYKGFHYVYRYEHPITNDNIDSAKYMGRVPYDFSNNYFLNLGIFGAPGGAVVDTGSYYLIINNDPWQEVAKNQGVFIATCTKQKTYYYAVTSDDANGIEDMTIVPGSNSTTVGVNEKVEPIEAYLQIDNLPLLDNQDMYFDAYTVYGGNQKTQFTPAMCNEGCLVFNFGIIADDDPGDNNAATIFFYGGGGNSYDNANSTNIDGMWKISMEDVIPNFSWDPEGGENTKWIGYNENFDVYNADDNSPEPTTGIDKTYTISRVAWTRDWLLRTFPNDIDSTRIYAHGSSNGCTGAMAVSYMFPDWIAACDVVNAKLNTEYLTDDNPFCKWNPNGTSRKHAELFLGSLEDNLPSDVPKIEGEGYYNIWDWANFNVLVRDNKYNSLPVTFLTSGKTDDVTCWEEKIQFYKTVNEAKAGGFYYWDLRSHKGGNHDIKDLSLETLLRYNTRLSYPAFSNCSLNDDPGDTNNPVAPWYDGDTVGAINGVLDWVDASIAETSDSWQTQVFSQQFELVDGSFFPFEGLPPHLRVDITPRRLQQFVNIPDGSILCMENWEGSVLKQSKTVTYHTNSEGKGLITFRKVKVRPFDQGGNLIKIYKCGGPMAEKSIGEIQPVKSGIDNIYPNPTNGSVTVEISMVTDGNVTLFVENILGERLMTVNEGELKEGEHDLSLDLSSLPAGIYIIDVKAGAVITSHKVIKE